MKKYVLFLTLLLPLVGLGQEKLQKVRVTPQWTPQSQFAGIYMAKEKGFYEEVGLDVEIIHPSAAISSANLLRNGETDIITSQLIEALIYKDSGLDIVNILQTAEHNSLYILSREPLESVKDLNHKKIGRWSAGFTELAMAFASANALDIEWIPVLTNIAVYISGALDATLCMGYNEFFQLKMSGTPITEKQVVRLRDIGYDVPEDGFYALESYAVANPTVVAHFVEATKRGWLWVSEPENREETLDCVMRMVDADNLPTNRVNQAFMLDELIRLQRNKDGETPFFLSKERFDFTTNLLMENNFIMDSILYENFVRTY